MNGIRANLNAVLEERCKRAGYDDAQAAENIPLEDAAHILARLALTNEPTPPSAKNWPP